MIAQVNMITIEQWRCAISGFNPPRSAVLCSKAKKNCVYYQDYTFHARLVIMCFLSWGFYFELSILNHYVDPIVVSATVNIMTDCILSGGAQTTNVCYDTQRKFLFSKLLLSGDIETNPGPTTTQLSLLVKTAREEIATLRNELKELKRLKNEYESTRAQTANELRDIKRELSELKTMKEDLEKAKEDINQMHNYHDELNQRERDNFKETTMKIEKQEIYSRRENIVLKGIQEDNNEDVQQKVLDILNTNCNADDKVVASDFQRLHRIGKPDPNKPRPVIARFVSFKKKLTAMQRKDTIKQDKNVHMTNDLTSKQRKTLFDHHNAFPQDKVYFKGEHLYVNHIRREQNYFSNNANDTADDTRAARDRWRGDDRPSRGNFGGGHGQWHWGRRGRSHSERGGARRGRGRGRGGAGGGAGRDNRP